MVYGDKMYVDTRRFGRRLRRLKRSESEEISELAAYLLEINTRLERLE